MNEWVERSIGLANAEGYLDRLTEVYPADLPPKRPLADEEKEDLIELHTKGAFMELIELLLGLTKKDHPFPIEHPYASLIRQRPELIAKNPGILTQLEGILMAMDAGDIIQGVERPIEINRRMGPVFQNWLRDFFPKHGVPVLPRDEFEKATTGAFLDGKDKAIREYAVDRLNRKWKSGRDFLYRKGDTYVVGEARFLSTAGGSQTRDLDNTISFLRANKGLVVGVAIMDGIVWLNKPYVKVLSSLADDEPVLSVLLLEEYLQSLA